MSGESRQESRRGRSISAAIFVSIVAVFIVTTTTQIARGVFGKSTLKSNPPAAACVAGISRMNGALDRAVASTSQITDEHGVTAAFANAVKPEWDDSDKVHGDCAGTPEGQDAFAALLRLRRAEETSLERHIAEVSPMKRDVAAYLR